MKKTFFGILLLCSVTVFPQKNDSITPTCTTTSICKWSLSYALSIETKTQKDVNNFRKDKTINTVFCSICGRDQYITNAFGQKEDIDQEWSGTGFALNNGYVATNYHVVEDAETISVSGINGDFYTSYTANVVATDKVNDLAIIKISDSRFKGFGSLPYNIRMQMAEVGEDVFVLGYPLTQTMGDEIKLTNGIISSRTGFKGDVSLYQMSAPIQPGNSGGPMFDSKGSVIGIVCAHHRGAENVGYAIKTSYLKNLAESASITNVFPTNNSVSALPLSKQVKKLKRFVYLIRCSSQGRTIYYPSVSTQNTSHLSVMSVTLSNSYTAIVLRSVYSEEDSWRCISPDTYIY